MNRYDEMLGLNSPWNEKFSGARFRERAVRYFLECSQNLWLQNIFPFNSTTVVLLYFNVVFSAQNQKKKSLVICRCLGRTLTLVKLSYSFIMTAIQHSTSANDATCSWRGVLFRHLWHSAMGQGVQGKNEKWDWAKKNTHRAEPMISEKQQGDFTSKKNKYL